MRYKELKLPTKPFLLWSSDSLSACREEICIWKMIQSADCLMPLMWTDLNETPGFTLVDGFYIKKKQKNKKTIPKTNQGSSNAQQKHFETYTRRKVNHTVIHLLFPGIWVKNQGVCLVCPNPLSLYLLQSLFGHHDWTDKHVVVIAETVNTNTDNTRPLEL